MARTSNAHFLTICGFLFSVIILFSPQTSHAQADKPFIFPVATPPSPTTWLLGQPYGNTIGAFLRGAEWYSAGQRLHFGIDISMRCGTPLVAIGDGEVLFVDDLGFGSGPHNLLIRHQAEGVISLYGHLLERPTLVPGQFVGAGQQIGLSGDPDLTCDSRPHLHLEIRSLNYFTAYNPVDYINADWHTLSLIGSFGYPNFQQDLDNPRRWMSIDDQPIVNFGGQALNNYSAPYPDRSSEAAPVNAVVHRQLEPLPENTTFSSRPLAFNGCCATSSWHPTRANTLYLIDGNPNERASIFEWDSITGEMRNAIGQAPPPHLSPDGTHEITLIDNAQTRIRNLTDNTEWIVNTEGRLPTLSADNSRLLWVVQSDVITTGQSFPLTAIWVSDANGSNARMIAQESRLTAQWLDDARLLITRRIQTTNTLGVFDTRDNTVYLLGTWSSIRQLSVSPGGGHLMFYVVNPPNDADAGMYLIETAQDAQAQRLEWFGAWRWRDAQSVFYIPFDNAAYNTPSLRHELRAYDILTGQDQQLAENFTVADGTWSVSANGAQIAFWNADDKTIWLLEQTNP